MASRLVQGRYFHIGEEAFAEIVTYADVDDDEARRLLLNYDWSNAAEHQKFLDTKSVSEIVAWLLGIMHDEDQAELAEHVERWG